MAEYAGAHRVIVDSIGMTYAMLNKYQHPACSISGGSDSDIVLDLCFRLDAGKDIAAIMEAEGCIA